MLRLRPVAFVLCATLGLSSGAAEKPTPTARLRKLSLNLRGIMPTAEEYQEFSWLNSQQVETALANKRQTYLESAEFKRKFFDRIMDSLRLNQNSDQSAINGLTPYEYGIERNIVIAFKSMLNRKASWNEIIGSPEFNALNESAGAIRSLLNTFPTFVDQNNKLKNLYGVSRRQATEILLGVRPIPLLLTSPSARSNLERIRQLNAKAVANAETMGTVAGLTFLKMELYRLVSQQKISNEEFSRLTKSIDDNIASVESSAAPSSAFRLFGTEYLSLQKNVDLYELALDNTDAVLKSQPETIEKLRNIIIAKVSAMSTSSNSKSMLGIVSTDAYSDRFKQTKFSRAAALFRIFFCDEMKPIALGGADLTARAVRGISPRGHEALSQDQSADSESADEVAGGFDPRHSAEKACQGCHRKLDPAQRTFNRDVLINANSPLEFVYDDENGQERRIKTSSYAELIPTIQNQRAYKICQARKFWNWTIGSDVPLSGAKLEEILRLYDNSNSVQAFIAALVSREEFKIDTADPNQMTFETVKPIFQRCHSCHQAEPMVANFTSLPFGSNSEHLNWLERIIEQTALFHNGRSANMPPARANWRLEEDQLKLLGRWLYQKAPDGQGRPTISDTDRNKLFRTADRNLVQILSASETREPIFGETWLRYIEKRDFWYVLRQIFPQFDNYSSLPNSCKQLVTNTGSFGFTDRLTGQVQSKKPTFGFLSIWTSCVSDLLKNAYYKESIILYLTQTNGFSELSGVLGNGLPKMFTGDLASWFSLATEWKKVRPAARLELISRIVDRLLGPATQPNQAQIKKDVFDTINDLYDNKTGATVDQVLNDIVVTIMSRDEFLSF